MPGGHLSPMIGFLYIIQEGCPEICCGDCG